LSNPELGFPMPTQVDFLAYLLQERCQDVLASAECPPRPRFGTKAACQSEALIMPNFDGRVLLAIYRASPYL